MILYRKAAALKVFYYLLAVDGDIRPVELQRLSQIGEALAPEFFVKLRKTMIDECNAKLAHARDATQLWSIASEDATRALRFAANDEEGISARLLVWDLIVVAYCDGQCSDVERRFIMHIANELAVEDDLVIEMHYLAGAALDIENELNWVASLNSSNSEIRLLENALKARIDAMASCAQSMINEEHLEWGNEDDREKPYEIEGAHEFLSQTAASFSRSLDGLMEKRNKHEQLAEGGIQQHANKSVKEKQTPGQALDSLLGKMKGSW